MQAQAGEQLEGLSRSRSACSRASARCCRGGGRRTRSGRSSSASRSWSRSRWSATASPRGTRTTPDPGPRRAAGGVVRRGGHLRLVRPRRPAAPAACSPTAACLRDAGDPSCGQGWRWWHWPCSARCSASSRATGTGPARLRNPLAIGGPVGDALEAGVAPGGPLFGVVVLLALASVVVRFRRARGVERQQLKWFGYAIGLLLCGSGRGCHQRGDRLGADRQRRLDRLPRLADLRDAARDRRRDPALPPLRHRPGDPAHAGLRRAHAYARRRVPRQRAARRPCRWTIGLRGRGFDAGRRGAVPPGARPYPGRGRPALLPPPLRRGADARGVRTPVA